MVADTIAAVVAATASSDFILCDCGGAERRANETKSERPGEGGASISESNLPSVSNRIRSASVLARSLARLSSRPIFEFILRIETNLIKRNVYSSNRMAKENLLLIDETAPDRKTS